MNYYKRLDVYKQSIALIVRVYKLTRTFPRDERYELISQLHRAVVSIASNIAEGSMKGSKKEMIRFLYIAFGSTAEVDTQLEVSYQLGYISKAEYENVQKDIDSVSKMINGLIRKLEQEKRVSSS